MIVGLSGKYCAGKDIVARAFAAEGFHVIDVDGLGHEALAARAGEVIAAFGAPVESPPGAVDRKALGRIVFADPAARARLEAVVHPRMVERVREEIASHGRDVVVNAAVLHRMGLHRMCAAVICVVSPWPRRLLRAMRRGPSFAAGGAGAPGGSSRHLSSIEGGRCRYLYCAEQRQRSITGAPRGAARRASERIGVQWNGRRSSGSCSR
jgi:dephospho-CoA kinase